MKDGRVEEFDHPHSLLQNPDSLFTSMVQNTDANAPMLFKMAKEAYENKNTRMPTHSTTSDTTHAEPQVILNGRANSVSDTRAETNDEEQTCNGEIHVVV